MVRTAGSPRGALQRGLRPRLSECIPLSPQGVVQQFLVLLTTSPDESLRFLSFRLDFNEHYRAREPRLRVSLGARGRRSSHT